MGAWALLLTRQDVKAKFNGLEAVVACPPSDIMREVGQIIL